MSGAGEPTDKTCWWCNKIVDTSKRHVFLENPLEPKQPLAHTECYLKWQEIFY